MEPSLSDFKKAVERLEEVLDLRKTSIVRDSAIKRFELCFDLAWKVIKVHAKKEGFECISPRSCFQTAFKLKWIEHDPHWLDMISDRNNSVHLYRESFADHVYKKLPKYHELFKGLLEKLE